MSDAGDLSVVQDILKSVGLHVETVPTAQTQRCDLRAFDAHEHYLIEVKGFHDDVAINKTLREGHIYERSRSFDASNAVEAAIREAVQQLQETLDKQTPELRIIFLLSRNKYDAEVISQQILAVLYGKRSLISRDKTSQPKHFECLYFDESALFRHRHGLDAVVMIDTDGCGAFYVNDYSGNIARVRESMLGQFFMKHKVFYDVGTWEKQGWLIADCVIDRGNKNEVRQYIERKYRLGHTSQMEFKRFGGIFVVPNMENKIRP